MSVCVFRFCFSFHCLTACQMFSWKIFGSPYFFWPHHDKAINRCIWWYANKKCLCSWKVNWKITASFSRALYDRKCAMLACLNLAIDVLINKLQRWLPVGNKNRSMHIKSVGSLYFRIPNHWPFSGWTISFAHDYNKMSTLSRHNPFRCRKTLMTFR